jgi:hypothetical protein
VTELEQRLRHRIDQLLDERSALDRLLDAKIDELHKAQRAIEYLKRETPTRRREERLRKTILKLRARGTYWRECAYRFKRQRDMWETRARLTHEERLARQRRPT